MHTGTVVAWDNRAKQRLWKSRVKVNKSMGDPCKARVSQLVIYNFICVCVSVCLCVCLSVCASVCVKAKCFDISAWIATKLHTHTHTLKICLGRFLSPFRSARLLGSGGNSPLSRFNWRKVWTGVKCNFSSTHRHNQYVVGKLSISRVRMWNFTRIGRKTKKLWLSIIPARRQWPVTTHKKEWTTTYLRRNWTSCMSLESSRSWKLKYAASAGWAKR